MIRPRDISSLGSFALALLVIFPFISIGSIALYSYNNFFPVVNETNSASISSFPKKRAVRSLRFQKKNKVLNTVSKARKKEKHRTRCQNKTDQMVLRLQLIAAPIINIDRAKVIQSIPRKGKRINLRFRTIHWIINETMRLIPLENNYAVLLSLLRLLSAYPRYTTQVSMFELAKHLLLKEIPSIRVRCAYLKMLDRGHATAEVLKPCCELIENFYARGGQLTRCPMGNTEDHEHIKMWEDYEMHLVMSILFSIYMDDEETSILLVRNKAVMQIAFAAVMIQATVEGDECWETAPSGFLGVMLRELALPEQIYVLENYKDNMIAVLLFGSVNMVSKIMGATEFVAFAITNDLIINKIWRRFETAKGNGKSSLDPDRFSAPMDILKYALTQNQSMVEKYLAMGVLDAAAFYAHKHYHEDAHRARFFASVLAVAPAWKGRFRQLTTNGQEGDRDWHGHVTRLGKSIQLRTEKPPTSYVMEEDVDQF